jgi:membrane protease YdiL (CAAX protease family)
MKRAEGRYPRAFLIAVVFELALAGIAIAIGWFLQINPSPSFSWPSVGECIRELGWGVAAAIPPLGVFVALHLGSFRPIEKIRRWLNQVLLPMLDGATLGDLAVLALAAGLGEELLFRGLLQNWLIRLGDGGPAASSVAVVLAGAAFGMAHFVNWTYAFLAAAIGIYLGWLLVWTQSLWIPILAHATYDFVALWYLCLRRGQQKSEDMAAEPKRDDGPMR